MTSRHENAVEFTGQKRSFVLMLDFCFGELSYTDCVVVTCLLLINIGGFGAKMHVNSKRILSACPNETSELKCRRHIFKLSASLI